jgi:hypothetical protein
MTWQAFQTSHPQLADFGKNRLAGRVAYLATVRKDGSPRVHPVTPIIGEGHLFVFMEPTSPKGQDIRRNGRYALHCGVEDNAGGRGEFIVSGAAFLTNDPGLREVAARHSGYAPKDRYILFEFHVEEVRATTYEGDRPVRQRWRAGGNG